MHDHATDFPFETALSLESLIAFWNRRLEEGTDVQASVARIVLDAAAASPVLSAPIDDLDVLFDHQDGVDALMTALFPAGLSATTYAAAIPPFRLEGFYMTPAFARLDLFSHIYAKFQRDYDLMMCSKIMMAYAFIMHECYGRCIDAVQPMLVPVVEENGLTRYFKFDFDTRFCTVVPKGDLPRLSEEEIQSLIADRTNLERWYEILPPALFAFHGIIILSAVEVTDGQIISGLKHDLLRKDALATPGEVDHIQMRIRSLLRCPEIEIGLIAIEEGEFDRVSSIRPLGRSLLLKRGVPPDCPTWNRSLYASATDGRLDPIVVERLGELPEPTGFETYLIEQGYHSLILAPLFSEERLVGILELASRRDAGLLDPLSASVYLREITSLFGVAIHRGIEEQEDRIQAIIKEQYTSIHPAVEWRFRQAAKNYAEARKLGESPRPEEIVFQEVYPLYGLSDIRGSSTERNRAIQADLKQQLSLAHDVLLAVQRIRTLPVIDEVRYRLSTFIADIDEELRSGDELSILHFLQNEIEALFDEFVRLPGDVADRIARYRAAIDPDLGILYQRRREFEESVGAINDTIGAYIDREQERAQRMYPHYFEMYKTDGVDYSLYVGRSLHEQGYFDRLYLRNLRLWQLMLMCGVDWEMGRLRPNLTVPLDIAHLVLVQDLPISIRFRIDEKQFDVDGAYNIRYEIVKKRIDKARIYGTSERLTQPGHVAVVYTQEEEAAEYRRYLVYLRAAGYLVGDIEAHTIEDLQGVHGLRALRARIAPQPVDADAGGPRSMLDDRTQGDGLAKNGQQVEVTARDARISG